MPRATTRETTAGKSAKAPKPVGPVDPTAFKRDAAGAYRSGDSRFSIEQASGRWLVVDSEQQDDLGLPLVRGPFETLASARSAAQAAREGPAPASDLRSRRARPTRASPDRPAARSPRRAASTATPARPAARPAAKPPPLEIRRYAAGDGPAMRRLWVSIGFTSVGDDEESLDRMAERNPGLLLVAAEADRIVGTALGAWDGRRGWIYHLGTDADHRRAGLGRRLVHEIERKLRALGCPRVNVIVHGDNAEGAAFWEALGYASKANRQFGREL